MELSKRRRSVFEAIEQIESEDVQAEKLRRKRSTTDVAQAKAAQSQIKVYASLLECRILLQRVITATATKSTTKEQQDGTLESRGDIQEECNQILEMLLKARVSLMGEELMMSGEHSYDYGRLLQSEPTTLETSEKQLPQVLQSEYESCRDYWKEVLNRRYKDLRLHAGLTSAKQAQFRVIDSSFWHQVEATVLTQEAPWKRVTNHNDDEITFDDTKLYRQMLQDFVSLSSSTRGSEEMAAQRLRRSGSQSNNNDKNKQVDRKASKGRKIRYATIPKLVNFTFPMTRPQHHSAMLDENEWFQSLFGGAGRTVQPHTIS